MSQENVEVLEAAYAAIGDDNLDAFLALAHPDIEFRSLIAEAEGWSEIRVMELGGLEPPTSWVRSRRSSS
jgi:hypothetical protein